VVPAKRARLSGAMSSTHNAEAIQTSTFVRRRDALHGHDQARVRAFNHQ
jgi:hypothetical protein